MEVEHLFFFCISFVSMRWIQNHISNCHCNYANTWPLSGVDAHATYRLHLIATFKEIEDENGEEEKSMFKCSFLRVSVQTARSPICRSRIGKLERKKKIVRASDSAWKSFRPNTI